MVRWARWCEEGCGKRVFYTGMRKDKKNFVCKVCGKTYSRDEL